MDEVTGLDRKDSHLAVCLSRGVEWPRGLTSLWAGYRFDHDALPEINKSEIDLSCHLLGRSLSAPICIGAMTGGTERSREINRRLGQVAQKTGVAMALGSQRKMIENPAVRDSYAIKDMVGDLPFLFGNLGVVQLNYGVSVKEVLDLARDVGADAFNFHLNCLQEAVQPEGNTDFSSLLPKLREVMNALPIPSLIKEVGSGISETTALKLKGLPLKGIETAGVGGTSWAKVESERTSSTLQKHVGQLFGSWGVPTPESIEICRKYFPDRVVVASGGIRNGIEIGKALGLGADLAAMALPVLKATEISVDQGIELVEQLKEELRTLMFVTGSRTLAELKTKKLRKAVDLSALERDTEASR